MEIQILTTFPSTSTSTFILPLSTSDALAAVNAAYQPNTDILTSFEAKHGDFMLTYLGDKKVILLGLGEEKSFARVLRAFRALSHRGQHLLKGSISIDFLNGSLDTTQTKLIEAAINGFFLGKYQIGQFKSEKPNSHPLDQLTSITLIASDAQSVAEAAQRGLKFAGTQMRILDLVNAPSNKKRPSDLANWALRSGEELGYTVEVFDKEKITALGMGALLAVNQGSIHPPTFTIMDYNPPGAQKTVCLVGKGVTFDTGGLSIKTAAGMPLMKSDMGGAAAVLGAVDMAARLKLPHRVIGLVPSTDNCVGSDAFKPSDVIPSYSGKTIEIIDTDAEGRLILADALAYATRHFQPDVMIDLATLTGSTVRTLGYTVAGLFSKNETLKDQLFKAGLEVGEKNWPLPLWDEYHEELQSDVADIKNLGTKPMAGAIVAAKFLEFFTDEHPAWAHLDIAGVAFTEMEFSKHKSATAYGVRLLVEFMENM